jgi:hypothetical protein
MPLASYLAADKEIHTAVAGAHEQRSESTPSGGGGSSPRGGRGEVLCMETVWLRLFSK